MFDVLIIRLECGIRLRGNLRRKSRVNFRIELLRNIEREQETGCRYLLATIINVTTTAAAAATTGMT